MTTYYTYLESPVGRICLQADGQFLTGLHLPDHKHWPGVSPNWHRTDTPFAAVRGQLAGYFAGERTEFDIPLKLIGTPFQNRVWQELARIPFGVTISYGELARRVGQPTASRAVGSANGKNPISIIVPCHRVIATSGNLIGYGGGLLNKQWLLQHEHSHVATCQLGV